ncbi:MAG: CBS domain-containing protein [Thermodesulfobacteriota bacterium]
METIKVGDVMVPLDQYATISEDATLYDAVVAMEEGQQRPNDRPFPYRAILVCDAHGKVLGKLGQLDVLRSLEPKYSQVSDLRKVSGFGITSEYLRSIMHQFDLWKTPLDDLCHKALQLKVGDVVRSPFEGEIIDEQAGLDKAIHQLIVGHFQSLLVTSKGIITGIVRLVDVYDEVMKRMKACKV